ncbi:hypothetical protein [Pontibacter flavimaris]|uniref:Lipoprotein n=1 Tax=Pontibacter flavimaris TaxID=1797110 RepID=A0A1Q5PIP9_9BACT|nr:hypothetical protein [Pontibacter flavimaris]OKL42072.1 hypothetical protein A3841_08730 [Pontibacter flavimaris]
MRKSLRGTLSLCAAAMLLLITSCVTIPKASVELSGELTQMILHARVSHLRLLDQYTRLQKDKVDKFMEEDYVPSFTANFVKESGVLANIQSASTDEEKGTEIIEFAQAAIPIIDGRRSSMMKAVDEMDRLIRSQVEAHYQEMLHVNRALTAHLGSAAEVVETRKQLQRQLNVDTESLIPIDKVNQVMEKMLKAGAKAEDIPSLVNDFKEKVNKVTNGKAE